MSNLQFDRFDNLKLFFFLVAGSVKGRHGIVVQYSNANLINLPHNSSQKIYTSIYTFLYTSVTNKHSDTKSNESLLILQLDKY